MEKVWDAPVRPPDHDDAKCVSRATATACSVLRLLPVRRELVCNEAIRVFPSSQACKQERLFFQIVRRDYMSYTHDVTDAPGTALVPDDDKGKKMFWRMPQDMYTIFLHPVAIITCRLENWFLVGKMAKLDAVMCTSFCSGSPGLFYRILWYCEAQSKCFGDCERKCKKDVRSCLRIMLCRLMPGTFGSGRPSSIVVWKLRSGVMV